MHVKLLLYLFWSYCVHVFHLQLILLQMSFVVKCNSSSELTLVGLVQHQFPHFSMAASLVSSYSDSCRQQSTNFFVDQAQKILPGMYFIPQPAYSSTKHVTSTILHISPILKVILLFGVRRNAEYAQLYIQMPHVWK